MRFDSLDVLLPMLASPGGDEALCDDDRWWASLKLDGHRLIIRVRNGTVECLSRTGRTLNVIPTVPASFEVCKRTPGQWIFDGEYMPKDGTYHLFDILAAGDEDVNVLTYSARLRLLNSVYATAIGNLDEYASVVHLLPVWKTAAEKRAAVKHVRDSGGEGIVFKRQDSTYRFGRRSRDWLKLKFVKDVDCVVIDANRGGKTNWVLAVNDGSKWIEIGEVSGLTGDAATIELGSVVTVTCLYASDDNRLIQPVSPRVRHDKGALECTLDQLEAIRPNRNIDTLLAAN